MVSYIPPECIWGYSDPQNCVILEVIGKLFASLSLVGCCLVTLFMLVMKKYSTHVERFVLAISATAFVRSIPLFLSQSDDHSTCAAQGFLIQYTAWLMLLWVFIITMYVLFNFIERRNFIAEYFWFVCGAVFIFPLVLAVLPFIGDNYTEAGIWCWIHPEETALRFGIWYIPFFIILLAIIFIYVYITVLVYRETLPLPGADAVRNQRYRQEVKPLFVYPMIYVVCYTPIAVYRINDALDHATHPSFGLAIISIIFTSSLGLVNSIAYACMLTQRHEVSIAQIREAVLNLFRSQPVKVWHNFETTDEPVDGIHLDDLQSTSISSGSNS